MRYYFLFVCVLLCYINIWALPIQDTLINKDTINLKNSADSLTTQLSGDTIATIAFDSSAIQITDSIFDTIVSTDTFSIIAVGDIMLGTDYPFESYLPPNNNCNELLKYVKHYLKSGDITFGNCEGSFAGERGTPKNCRDPKSCYVFRMPESYVNCFTEAGFNLLSVANNHVNDFGLEGRKNTTRLLQNTDIHFAGFEDVPFTVFKKDEIKIGFTAVSPNTGTVDLHDTARVRKILNLLNDSCDIVILSIHGGAEGKAHQHITRKNEIFYDQDRGNIYNFSRFAIDNGADVVIGHGPHVTRAVDIYNNKFIAYSLGNFATYARFNLSGPNGVAPLLKININSKGELISAKVTSIYQDGEGIPKPDPLNRAWEYLKQLTQQDIPEVELIFEENIIKPVLQNK